jgi:hypothetical protein
LTALILDAYNDLGAAVERAEARVERPDRRARWRATCGAIRKWARRHPHEYALIFGTPVPGYAAPQETVAAATRTTRVMAVIVADQYRNEPLVTVDDAVTRALEWSAIVEMMPRVPTLVAARAIIAWTQIYGAVNFELFGHYVGSVRNAAAMFELMVNEMADLVGLSNDL